MSGKLYQVQNGQKVDVTPTIAALTDVSSKADVTLGNLTAVGKAAMTHAAMPSGQYIDLTLPASGGSVIAPDDGYIYFEKYSTAAYQYIQMASSGLDTWQVVHTSTVLKIWLPVKKNSAVGVGYNADGATTAFRFIYANGSAPQP